MSKTSDQGNPRTRSLRLYLDAHGVIRQIDGDPQLLFAKPTDDFVGRSATIWVHPDDLAVAITFVSAVERSHSGELVFRCRIGDHESGWAPFRCAVDVASAGLSRIDIEPSRRFTPSSEGSLPSSNTNDAGDAHNPIDEMIDDAGDDFVISADDDGVRFVDGGLLARLSRNQKSRLASYPDLFHPDENMQFIDYLDQLYAPDQHRAEGIFRVLTGPDEWTRFRIRTRDLTSDSDVGSYITVIHELRPHEDVADVDSNTDTFGQALSLAADPIVALSADGRIRFASSAMGLLTGQTFDGLADQPLTQVLAPESVPTFERWWQAATRGSCRLRVSHVDGSTTWVLMSVVRHADRDGHTSSGYRVATLRDIHEQVEAELALSRREARFEALVRNSSTGVVILDDSDRIISSGHALETVLGFRSDSVEGMALPQWVHPDDAEAIAEVLSSARTSSQPFSTTVRQRVADGTDRWIRWTVQDHRSDPDIAGLVVNLDDRTEEVSARIELENSGRRIRAIVDHSFEVTVIADGDFVILWASPSLADLLGWDANVVPGNPILDFVHPDDREEVLIRYNRALTDDGPEPTIPLRIRTATGGWRHVVVVAADRRDDPDVGGIILNLRDAEDQVASANALAESEHRYRVLVENSTDIVAILDEHATVKWVSATVETVLGHRADDLIGQALGGVDERSERDEMLELFQDVVDHPGSNRRMLTSLMHADGTWRWAEGVATNRLDEPGINGIIVAYRDVTERVEADLSLQASEQRFRSLSESSPLGIFQLDADQRCTYVNDRWCEITGQTPSEALGEAWRQPFRLGGTDLWEADNANLAAFDPGIPLVRPDGTTRWCSLHLAPLTDSEGTRIGSVGTIDDITSTVIARHEARRLSSILESSPDLVMVFSPIGELVYLNEAARRFFSMSLDEPVDGLTAADILDHANLEFWTSVILPTLQDGEIWQGEVSIVNRSGISIPISAVVNVHRDVSGLPEVVSVTARDMTERAELEARLEHQATHDPLTGLPNRSLLLDRLEVALARSKRHGGHVAVLFADLDRFKVVNDGLGHATGDDLLRLIARRLATTIRPGDTVARLGGDEFVIVCEDLADEHEAEVLAERLSAAVAEPATIGGSEIVISLSMGITTVTDPDEDPDQLIRDADAAMYVAKQQGRARWEIFNPVLRSKASNRLVVENALRRALQTGEFVLNYQPVVDARSARLVGAEALLRWNHPDRGLLGPGHFLDIAEESGLIVPIGDWVLGAACKQMQRIMERDRRFSLSVNLSARQIADSGLISRIDTILDESSADPGRVILELTESVLMGEASQSGATLAALKSLGVGLAIDDFGTGYSSLAYLQRYPIDVLKIDRSFVAGLGQEAGDEAIVEAIISLAEALDLHTTAEGAEHDAQLAALRRLGCEYIQGFLVARPMDFVAFSEFVDRTDL